MELANHNPDEYPNHRKDWAIALIPEIALGVFLAVMVFALVKNGGPYVYAGWLLPVLAVTLLSLKRLRERTLLDVD